MAYWFGSLWADLAYSITVITVSILTFFYYRFTYWSRKGVPYLKPTIPFGNVKNLILKKKSFTQDTSQKYFQIKKTGNKFGGYYTITTPTLMIVDPELIKQILTKDFNYFHDRTIYFDEKNDPLSAHLFTVRGKKWKQLRSKMSPTLTSGKMKMMFDTLLACCDELENILDRPSRTSSPIDIKDVLARFTTDVIGSCAFGLNCNSLKDPQAEFYQHGKFFMATSLSDNTKTVIGGVFPSLLRALKIPMIHPKVSKFFMSALKNTIEYREKNNYHRSDFVDLFIKMKNNENIQDEKDDNDTNGTNVEPVTFNELAAQAFIFFIAGFEASSTTVALALYELSLYPDIQEKLRKEILESIRKHNGKLTYEGVLEMQYLDKVVSETLRKYPTAPIARTCTEPYKIPGTNITIEKDTPVWISPYGLQNDPEYFPNPEKFDPERFSPEEKAKRHPCVFLPFGEGPRICVGMRFALLQTKIGLASLLKDYIFSLHPKTKLPLKFQTSGILLAIADTLYLQAKRVAKTN